VIGTGRPTFEGSDRFKGGDRRAADIVEVDPWLPQPINRTPTGDVPPGLAKKKTGSPPPVQANGRPPRIHPAALQAKRLLLEIVGQEAFLFGPEEKIRMRSRCAPQRVKPIDRAPGPPCSQGFDRTRESKIKIR
jgi:hypothetical protein